MEQSSSVDRATHEQHPRGHAEEAAQSVTQETQSGAIDTSDLATPEEELEKLPPFSAAEARLEEERKKAARAREEEAEEI